MEEAIGRYINRFRFRLIYRIMQKVPEEVVAEEVLTDVTISLIEQYRRGKLKKEADIPRFCTVILSSRCVDHIRKLSSSIGKGSSIELVADQYLEDPNSPEEEAMIEELSYAIEDAIADMEEGKEQTVLFRHFIEGRSVATCAIEAGVSRQYASRLVKNFKEGLVSEGT